MNLSTLTPQDIAAALVHKQWLVLSALLIGLTIRLLKSDTRIPWTIPPAVRSWTALGLGAAVGVIDKAVQDGATTWTWSLLQGVGIGVVAMLGHVLFIESLRGGKEIPVPGLTIPGAAPSPGKPPSIPAPPLTVPEPDALVVDIEDPLSTSDVTQGKPASAVVTVAALPPEVKPLVVEPPKS